MSVHEACSIISYDKTLVLRIADFFDVRDMGRCEKVSKAWNSHIASEGWNNLSAREGLPLVCGENRNFKEDFKMLQLITISGKRINQLTLAKMIGEIPPIAAKYFDLLEKSDPFGDGKIKDNFVFVVVPSLLEKTCGEEIPFSLRNFITLCSQRKSGPDIFRYSDHSRENADEGNVINQVNLLPKENTVYFMRKCVAEKTRGSTLLDYYRAHHQNKIIKELQGSTFEESIKFEVTPLIVRAIFDAVIFGETGQCPESDDYVNCSDKINFLDEKEDYQARIRKTSQGLDIDSSAHFYYLEDYGKSIGVAPGTNTAENSSTDPQ